jgi:hypothetical protein
MSLALAPKLHSMPSTQVEADYERASNKRSELVLFSLPVPATPF